MNFKNKLNISTSKKLKINTNLISGIEILSLSSVDLIKHINALALENVFLEELNPNLITYKYQVNKRKENVNYEDYIADHHSIQDNLISQLSLEKINFSIYRIAKKIVYSIDESGFFNYDYQEFIKDNNLCEKDFQLALAYVKSLKPEGIACKSVKDFLLLQTNDELETLLISKYFELILKNKIEFISKDSSIEMETIVNSINSIKKLKIKPINSFDSNSSIKDLINPDYIIQINDNTISLNENISINIRWNNDYIELYNKADGETKNFLSKYYNEALMLEKSINIRNKNLKKIIEFIVQYNKDYFSLRSSIKPLTMAYLAKELNLSESTVSRIVLNKYIESINGIKPMKFFFTSYVKSERGNISRNTIEKKIMSLISLEDKNRPLSDNDITDKLNEFGIYIKRRTVTKYRQELNIASSNLRKKH